ncbi:outer membrane beta-barrel protein [Psychromarinibacter sp. C21-152]|uniref:Outer membrane beta-barrel protein n=1 Tax=Psychromarinibacter sediminicola TaxID=3033385 RepID=A0AAE3NV03_9RHOB|nr:outer membrane beta-barrel protein [Psychromarinibacter sediminicola]MDF0601470.1 outer membrane beta-barrel protein [Psychromarinibacter sediminicola]
MKTLVIASVAALATAPAFAGNLTPADPDPVVTPPPAPATPVGYDWTGFYAGAQLGWGHVENGNNDANGFGGGVHAGYDWDFGDIVVGVAADYDLTAIESNSGNATLDNVARAKLRAGYDVGKVLFYGTGGAAWAQGSFSGTDYSDNGWFAGAGAEYRVNEKVSIAGEALYHVFDNFDGTGIDFGGTTVAARVSYRF